VATISKVIPAKYGTPGEGEGGKQPKEERVLEMLNKVQMF